MSTVAEEITRISGCRENIKAAIAAKGVNVPTGAKLADCPALITSITGGGGGEPTAMVNTGFSATGYKSAYVPFTATQISVPQYDIITTIIPANYNLNAYTFTAGFPSGTETGAFSAQIGEWATVNPTTGAFYRQDPYAQIGIWSALKTAPTNIDIYLCFSAPYTYTAASEYRLERLEFAWNMSNPGDISASYKELTGYEYPYPSYPVTTTGYVQNTIDMQEYFKLGNVHFSGKNQKIVNYDSSPSDSTANTAPTAVVSVFVDNGLKNWQAFDTAAEDTNYTYSYGASGSGYSGYTGI